MPLIRAWRARFEPGDTLNPSGGPAIPIYSVYALDSDRTIPDTLALQRWVDPNTAEWCDVVSGALWRDVNHVPRAILMLPVVAPVKGRGGRFVDHLRNHVRENDKVDPKLDLTNGELRTELRCVNLSLDKNVQLSTWVQYTDYEIFDGRGGNVNLWNVQTPSVSEALGAPTPYERSGVVTLTSDWIRHTTRLTASDGEWSQLHGSNYKVSIETYGSSYNVAKAMRDGELTNLGHIFNLGRTQPEIEPMVHVRGGKGLLIYRKFELWVQTEFNEHLQPDWS